MSKNTTEELNLANEYGIKASTKERVTWAGVWRHVRYVNVYMRGPERLLVLLKTSMFTPRMNCFILNGVLSGDLVRY